MERKVIDQTELVLGYICFHNDFAIQSKTIDNDKINEGNYRWLLVEELNGTEKHIATCLGSTWIGVTAT